MEHKLLFSLIVPVYNAEKYLYQCLDSITKQTYTNIEIILINDGSIDNSGIICDEFSQRDNRINVVHTENRGVSSARNLGLSIARGDYIAFVDSDDWLEINALEKIVHLLKDSLYDLIIYGVVKETNNIQTPLYSKLLSSPYRSNNDIKLIIPDLIKHEVINPPFKIYKHELIRKKNIRFNEILNIGEDYLFNMECFLSAKSLYIMDDILYHYMIRDNISLTRKFQENKYDKLMLVNEKLSELVSKQGNNEKIKEALLCIRIKNIYSCFMDIFNKGCKYSYQEKLSFLNKIIIKERKISIVEIKDKKYKLLALLLRLNNTRLIYSITRVLYRLKH